MDFKNDGLAPEKYTVLNPLAEALVLTTNSKNRNIILGALDLRGPLDLSALRATVNSIGDFFPQLKASLTEIKSKGRRYLVWDHRQSLEIPLVISSLGESNSTGYGFEALLKRVEQSLTRERNPFEEPASEFHLLRFGGGDRHILALILGHRAADAITLAEIVKVFMSNYHELVTGETSIFSGYPSVASTAYKRKIRKKNSSMRDYWDTFGQAMIPYQRCAIPEGNGVLNQPGEHYVKRLLSEDRTNSIAMDCARMRVPFVDYLMAGMALAIDRWNDARNKESSTLSAALTVNMQGRFSGADGPNNDSVLYFQFSRDQRSSLKKLARHVGRSRIRLFRDQMDIKYFKGMTKLNNFLRLLPFKLRQKAYLEILERHQTSFALGFMGVLWPESNGRRISGDSYLTSAGSLNIVEAHAMAYRIVSRTPLYLAVYFFRKKLNLMLSAAAWKFTNEEAKAFMDLVIDVLDGQPPEEFH
jgi:hypothetical protein